MKRWVLAFLSALLVAAVALSAVAFWQLWWTPKTVYSCDGLPSGASTPVVAAQEFTDALVSSDPTAMCAVLVDKLTDEQLEELAAEVREQLGAPSSADQVQMRLGDEDGSRSTLTLEGPGGTVEMSVFFFYNWYRVEL